MTETQLLFDLLEKGVSPAHVVSACEKRLVEAGFQNLYYDLSWGNLWSGRYYVKHNATTLFAFTIPEIICSPVCCCIFSNRSSQLIFPETLLPTSSGASVVW